MMNFLTLTTVPIDVLAGNGKAISKATGFFYESQNSELFLITNWHVVTGRHPSTPARSKSGAVPCVLRCKLHARQKSAGAIRLSQLVQLDETINSDDGNNPEWLEHPGHRHRVDVVAIKIGKRQELENQCTFHILNQYKDFEQRYKHEVMDDVFVIGYPWGLSSSGGALPVYKRGSIASEPVIDYLGLPRFLVDCRTARAMSGSPVIVEHSGIWKPTKGAISGDSIIGTLTNFIGVYSGRLLSQDALDIPQDEVSEIGIVWKKEALDAIVNNGVVGTSLDAIIRLGS